MTNVLRVLFTLHQLIGDEMLLGCDIIDKRDKTVNTRSKGAILMDGKWIQCEIARSRSNTIKQCHDSTIVGDVNRGSENQQCLD